MGNTHRKVARFAPGGDTAARPGSASQRPGSASQRPGGPFSSDFQRARSRSDADGGHSLMNLPTVQGLPISPELASDLPRASSVPITMHLSSWIDSLDMPDKNTMEECLKDHTLRAPSEELLRVPAPRTDTCLSDSDSSSVNFRKEIEAHWQRERCCVDDEVSNPQLDFGILQLETNCAC